MSWHYSNNDKQVGPISEAEFEASVKSGIIHGDTLVWKEGMPQWTSYREVTQSVGGGSVALATAERCVECGKQFSQDEMVNFAGAWVCAGCKPQYVQKIKEGVNVNGDVVYGGFWIRFAARFLDGILFRLIGSLLGFVAGFVGSSGGSRQVQTASVLAAVFCFLLQVAYEVFFIGKYGATLGKMAVKVKVVRSNGDPVTYARALGRFFAQMLSTFTLMIGYLMAAWDPEKRSLHDRICDTRVVKNA